MGGAALRGPNFWEQSGVVFILLLELNGQQQPLPGEGSKFPDLCCFVEGFSAPGGRLCRLSGPVRTTRLFTSIRGLVRLLQFQVG